LTPDAQVGLLYSNASKWGLTAQPALARGPEPDRDSYQRIVEAFYRGAFDARVPVRMVHDTQIVRDGTDLMDPGETARTLPVLLVPALYIASDHLLEWLRRYGEAGGHLVLGPRSAYADEEARARLEVKPALLSDAAGVSYQEFTNLAGPVPVRFVDGALDPPSGAHATGWADSLVVARAEVIVEYEHPFVGSWPAVVTAAHGEGHVTTVGTVPDPALARALVEWLIPVAEDAWRAVATPSVTVYSATSGEGRRLRFVHNWSWEPTGVVVPVAVRDVLSDDIIERDHEVSLGPWDVRVLIEE
jgi:beta-galactosidase